MELLAHCLVSEDLGNSSTSQRPFDEQRSAAHLEAQLCVTLAHAATAQLVDPVSDGGESCEYLPVPVEDRDSGVQDLLLVKSEVLSPLLTACERAEKHWVRIVAKIPAEIHLCPCPMFLPTKCVLPLSSGGAT